MDTVIRRVLMIDDDNEDYLIVKNMLMKAEGTKYEIIWANSFHAGLKEIQSDHYDAVLVDYELGRQSGLEIVRQASATGYPSPFILYTGRGSYEVDVEAMNAGATMYLTKGEVSPLLLERAIRYAIEMKQKEQKLLESEAKSKQSNERLGVELVERTKAEEKIAAEQAWFRITLASIGDAVITTDPNGMVTSLNSIAEDLTGWANSNAVGQPIEEIFSIINEVTGQKMEDPVGKVVQSGLIHGLAEQTALVARNGQVISVEDSAAPIQDGNGEILGVVMVFRDVTEKHKVELAVEHYSERLKRSNQELEEFAFIASHDLKEPLRKVKQFSELLKDQLGSSLKEETKDSLKRITSTVDRMQGMIDDLLELSRINSKDGNFEDVDLYEAANEVVTNLESRILEAQAQVMLEPLPKIEGDPMQMRELLQNLIGNAIKYHKPGVPPQVRVFAQINNAWAGRAASITLQVEDNGIGFEETQVERIFQPFQRLHGRGEYEGSGIGLAICKKIVERHKGKITALSHPGEGSTFIVELPLKQMK